MEILLGEALLSFDGRVVEAFGRGENMSGRVHLSTLHRLEIGKRRQSYYLQPHMIWGGSPFIIEFATEQLAQARAFAAEVDIALSTRSG